MAFRRRSLRSSTPTPIPNPGLLVLGALSLGLLVACTGQEATPIDPANPPVLGDEGDITDVTHLVEPNDQMRDLAEQQCLDDPGLAEGYIEAVDPETGEQVSEVSVDCDDVR